MRRATVSVCSNIAEGCGRRGDREFRRCRDVAMGSACELECELILSYDLAFISESLMDRLIDVLVNIKRMLGSLIRQLFLEPSTNRQANTKRANTKPIANAPNSGGQALKPAN